MPRSGLLVLLVALCGACSLVAGDLPEAAKETGGASSSGGSQSTGGSAGSGGEGNGGNAGQAGNPTGGGSSGGSASGGTGNVGGSGGAACVTACDCDDDGQQSTQCGGKDCDDNDKRVFFGQTEYFTEPSTNPKVLFDYDCSGQIERDPAKDHEVNCGLLNLGTCSGQGFSMSAPACGESGPWGECRAMNLTCQHAKLSDQVMACH